MKKYSDARLLSGCLLHPMFNNSPQQLWLWKRLQPLFVSIILFSYSTLVSSAEGTLSLESAMELTLTQNPQLRVFDFRDEALRGQAETAALKPAIEIGADIENIVGTGNVQGVDGAELTVSVSSVIELGNKREARMASIGARRGQLNAEMQVDALDLLGEVTRRYIENLAAQNRLALAQDAESLARETLQIVQDRALAGATPDVEVLRAEAALSQAELLVSAEENQLRYAQVALAALWGETNPTFESVTGDLYQIEETVSFENLFSRVQQNPFIQIFASEERMREAEVRLARTQSTADPRWSLGARRFQEGGDLGLVAGFSIPLFSAKRNSGVVRSAIAARDEVEVRREVALLNLRTQLFNAFQNRQQALITIDTLQTRTIPLLTEALSETQAAYESGRYSYLEWVTARQELIGARSTLIDAATAALRHGADIEQLTAEPLLSPLIDQIN
ncbi:TolC family protein [Marinobacter lipolyticus]|uniref:TolC family protein n=1 Tax=Marinobacter lipolyticus TaxID=209639 RepID=UPI003A9112F1